MYYNKLPNEEYIYLLLYADDMPIASKSISAIDNLKKELSSEIEMKDLCEVKKILDMEIEGDRKGDKVLQKFNINGNTKSVSTPLAHYFNLYVYTSIEEREYMTHVPYASAVDSLMYAMVCTRPDLSQAASMVSRYMHDPDRGHERQ